MKTVSIFNNNTLNDKRLIDEFKHGSQKAFYTIYDKYAFKLKNDLMSKNKFIREDVAEDYVTEAFIVLFEKIMNGNYQEQGRLYSYLYTIALNLYKKELNKGKVNITDDERMKIMFNEIFEQDDEKEILINLVEEILRNLTIGKNEKELSCQDIIYAQYGILKTSDEDYYNDYPQKFTNVLDVRRKRYKCLEKSRKLINKILYNYDYR